MQAEPRRKATRFSAVIAIPPAMSFTPKGQLMPCSRRFWYSRSSASSHAVAVRATHPFHFLHRCQPVLHRCQPGKRASHGMGRMPGALHYRRRYGNLMGKWWEPTNWYAESSRKANRLLAPAFDRLRGCCFRLFSLGALNVPPHPIVTHSHLVSRGVALLGGLGGRKCTRASHLVSIPLGRQTYADANRRVKTASRLSCSRSLTW